MTNNPSDAQDSPRPSLGKDSPAKRDSDTHAVVPKSDDGQNALHAALREACEKAANVWVTDDYDLNEPRIARLFERHLTPVVEALVGAAYGACAEIYLFSERDPNIKIELPEYWKKAILSLIPESAARALREHDNALIEKCALHCDSRIKTAPNDDAAVAFALAGEEIRRIGSNIDALQSHSHYASYANHCAIRKVIPLTFHSWKRREMPKAPDDLSHPVEEEK